MSFLLCLQIEEEASFEASTWNLSISVITISLALGI